MERRRETCGDGGGVVGWLKMEDNRCRREKKTG